MTFNHPVLSDRLRVLLIIVLAGFICNSILLNGRFVLENQVEAPQVAALQQEKEAGLAPFSPVYLAYSAVYSATGLKMGRLRLAGPLLAALTLLIFLLKGRKLFGLPSTLMTTIVLASCLLVVNFSKIVAADIWLFCFQLFHFLALLYYLKRPLLKHAIFYWVLSIAGFLIHPLSMSLWGLVSGLVLWVLHPSGRRLSRLMIWLGWPLLWAGGQLVSGGTPAGQNLLLGYGQAGGLAFLLLMFLGVLPWLGFLPAGIWEMIRNARRREEMAIVSVALLAGALASYSLIVQAAFALLIGRQLTGYFQPGYPYQPVVKTAAVLNLLLILFAAILISLWAYYYFDLPAFRSFVWTLALFWALSFATILGLFSQRRFLTTVSAALGGVLLTLCAWSFLYEKLDSPRLRLVSELEGASPPLLLQVYALDTLAYNYLEAYAFEYGVELQKFQQDSLPVGLQPAGGRPAWFLLEAPDTNVANRFQFNEPAWEMVPLEGIGQELILVKGDGG